MKTSPPPGARILHVAFRSEWTPGEAYDRSSRGLSLADEGFLHASTTAQTAGVLARYYADVDPADLVLLVLDVDALDRAGSPVRWDPAGTDGPYPHVHGPVPPGAVVAALDLAGGPGAPHLPDPSQLSALGVLERPGVNA